MSDRSARVQTDAWLAELASATAMAMPSPWIVRSEGDMCALDSGSVVVERGLSPTFARYAASLRHAADALLAPQPMRARRKTELGTEISAAMRAVGARWVFVAPTGGGDSYFLHDCIRKVSAGQIRRADALFLDTAKTLLPHLLRQDRGAEPKPGGGCVVIPRRGASEDVAAEYAGFAEAALPLQTLSGRNALPERTAAMIDAILAHVDVVPGSRVLDIGCGDATLLRRLAPQAARVVGTVLTEQERRKLSAEPKLAGIEFFKASFATIDRLDGPFDLIVANGCLHFVRSLLGADRAFAKLADLLAPGGRLWAGELHGTDCRRLVFTSKRAALRHVHDHHGRSFALAFARHLWRHRRRAQTIVERPPTDWWHVRPEAIAPLAHRHGLDLLGSWRCLDLTGDTFYALQDRFSCLLEKPGAL